MTEDEAMEALMAGDADFEDLSTDEDGFVNITADPAQFDAIKAALEAAKADIEFDTCETTLVPSTKVDLDADHEEKFRRMLSLLREYDDVSEIYHNANISEDEDEE